VRHAVQRGIWVPTQHLLYERGKQRKTLIELACASFGIRLSYNHFAQTQRKIHPVLLTKPVYRAVA
jgi:hypothetical protein